MRKYQFKTADQHLKKDASIINLKQQISQLDIINQHLNRSISDFNKIAHCGAVDYTSNTVVIFVNNNAAMYQINNMIGSIEDILKSNGFFFDKFLVKIRQINKHITTKNKIYKPLSTEQIKSLENIAALIGKPELVRSKDEDEHNDNEFEIELK